MNQQKIKSYRPTYAIIDLKAFAHNIEQARNIGKTDIIAVVKADAYGHGALAVSEYAQNKCGIKNFAVATSLEAIELRKHIGNKATIYCLGYVDPCLYSDMLENNITLSIFHDEVAQKYHDFIKSKGVSAKVSLEIDTGMSRLGYKPDMDFNAFKAKFPLFEIAHVMSHLSSADSDLEYSRFQKELFLNFLNLNNITASSSFQSSAGIVNLKNSFSFTRPGIMLYGYLGGNNSVDLKKVMKVYSKVVQIKKIKSGDTVSYNRCFRADREMTIGIVPIGYADGYLRSFSNKNKMYVNGVDCPVLGNVCMDMTMIDLSHVNLVEPEPLVEVLGENITAENWAEIAGTISYEVLCGVSGRIPRIYQD